MGYSANRRKELGASDNAISYTQRRKVEIKQAKDLSVKGESSRKDAKLKEINLTDMYKARDEQKRKELNAVESNPVEQETSTDKKNPVEKFG